MEFLQFSNCFFLKNNFEERSKSTFGLFHVNIRSMRKYWDQFMVIVPELDSVMDAFIITEINISEDIEILFCIPGYERFTVSRASGRRGGLPFYVKEGWCTTPITITMTHSEHMSLQIRRHVFSVILIAIYRLPANNVNLFLKGLDKALSEFSPINQLGLVGDFNINTLDSSRPTVCD